MVRGRRAAIAALGSACLALAPAAPATGQAEPDCTGPAGDPAPGSPEWDRREADNEYCATQRNEDTASNPAYQAALAQPRDQSRSMNGMDPFREPLLWDGSRFRFEEVSFSDAAGKEFTGLLFRPCDDSCRERLAGVQAPDPPYPGVVIMHGGAASQEPYMWAAEGFAEAGYMVLTLSIGRTADSHYEDDEDRARVSALAKPADVDRDRIGLAGHSAGGVAVSRLGQEDPRDRRASSPGIARSPGRCPPTCDCEPPRCS